MKTFKQSLTKSKESSSKYKEGEFGYWWTVIQGKEDIEGKVYDGDIDCSREGLTSLKGCPKEVKGSFDCSHNQLTTLEGGPKEVGGGFYCGHNNLTSLKGSPKEVKGDFWCNNNNLTTLEGAPKEVRDFSCHANKLTSLKGAPKEVGGKFDCRGNKLLTSLEGLPKEIKGKVYSDIKIKSPKKSSQKINEIDSYEEILRSMFKNGELVDSDDNEINYRLDNKRIKVRGYDSPYAMILCTAIVNIKQKIISYICEVLDDDGDTFYDLEEYYGVNEEFKFKDIDDFKKQLTKIRDLIKKIK